jgi:hypothetical protein
MKSSPEPGRRAIVLDANGSPGWHAITHDRKAANFRERAGVRCLHFRTLVDALQKRGLLTPDQARRALE